MPTTTTQMKRVSDNAASRSESRSGLDALASTSNSGDWQLGETSSSMDANLLSKSIADNPNGRRPHGSGRRSSSFGLQSEPRHR